MALPTLGELRFAHDLFASERRPHTRHDGDRWRRLLNFAIVLTFVFFLFM
jgi:hypothetical protein